MLSNWILKSRLSAVLSYCVVIILLIGVMGGAYNLRIHIWRQEQTLRKNPIFFTLESALLFRYARLSVEHSIPKIDMKVEYPQGIEPEKYFSLGGGIILGKVYILYRYIFHSAIDFETFHRYAMPAYFVVVSLLALFFIGWKLTGYKSVGLLVACMYGICIPAVLRSTGEEFMRENFALPLLFWHVAFFLYGIKQRSKYLFWISGTFLAGAWVLWDMSQLYMIALSVFLSFSTIKKEHLAGLLFPLILVAVWNPYLRYHNAVMSLPIMLLTGIFLIEWVSDKINPTKKLAYPFRFIIKCIFMFGIIPFICLATSYADNYGHFAQLLYAKLRFFNVKPLNPASLTFIARVLWTPALHSATLEQFWTYFGCIICISMVSVCLLFYSKKYSKIFSTDIFIIFCFLFFLLTYVLFVRTMVFTAFFGVLMLLFWFNWHNKIWHIVAVLILSILCFGEYTRTYSYSRCMGRGVNYDAQAEVITWIEKNTRIKDAILASFELGGPIVNYADRAIVLQPKFEVCSTRNRYRKFIETLFGYSEDSFYRFTSAYKARYFVFQKGTSWNRSIYAPAYFAESDSKDLEHTLAYRFDADELKLKNFALVFENKQYRIFRVISDTDRKRALALYNKAEVLFANSDLSRAESLYRQTLVLFPRFRKARMRLGSVLWMRGQTDEAKVQWNRGKTLTIM